MSRKSSKFISLLNGSGRLCASLFLLAKSVSNGPVVLGWHKSFLRIESMRFMQVLVNGLASGGSIALLALGFAVVYLPTRVFHIALAGVYALGPFLVWATMQGSGPWFAGVMAALGAGTILSLAAEQFNHSRLERKGAGSGLHLVSSLGLFIVIVQVIAMIWGNEVKVLRSGVDTVFQLGSITVTRAQLFAVVVSCVLLAVFYCWLRFSNLGLQFRALADNPIQLALFGYNTQRLRLLAFGMAGFLATASSLLTAFEIGFDPHSGLSALLLAVVAVIVGGRDSFLGPVVAGFLLGFLRAQVVWHFSALWQEAATFVVLVLILYIRPQGLLGKRTRLEAQS
jgi:branched-chain amino acid transport system permease protein